MSYNKHTKRVKAIFSNGARMILLEGLAELLGYEAVEISNPTSSAAIQIFESPYIADPNLDFRLFYIYSDIAEPGITGDVFAPLLHVITVKGQDGEMVHEIFDRAHYIPVARKTFQNIEIAVKTHTGQNVSFDCQKSIVKLHFRQKYLS